MVFSHVPVLYEEAMEYLNIRPDGIYADGTLGGAGHSQGICGRLDERGTLIGIDRDSEAISAAKERLRGFPCRCLFVHSNYSDIKKILRECGVGRIDGALLDLGVSSHQLDTKERGFSYMQSAPLDMRMDQESSFSAYDVVNHYEKKDLQRIIRSYGEEKWASRISDFIVRARQEAPIETTDRLVEVIKAAVPASARREGPHPAKRRFRLSVSKSTTNSDSCRGRLMTLWMYWLRAGGWSLSPFILWRTGLSRKSSHITSIRVPVRKICPASAAKNRWSAELRKNRWFPPKRSWSAIRVRAVRSCV